MTDVVQPDGQLVLDVVHHCTALELLAALPAHSAALCFADPPHGIGYRAGFAKTNGGQPRRAARTFGEDVLQLDWLPEAYRVLKPDGTLYLCVRWDKTHLWVDALEAAGFRVA